MQPIVKNIAAVVFDLDGTLIDSVADLAASTNHALGKLDLPLRTEAEITKMIGDGAKKLILRALAPGHEDRADEALGIFLTHYLEHCVVHTTLLPGTEEMLKALHGKYPLAVLTNKPRNLSEQILEKLKARKYFDFLMGGDSLPVKKPDPAGLFWLAEKWQLPVDRLLMVGDHKTDIATGRAAGCATVFLRGSIGNKQGLTPTAEIDRLGQLADLIAEL